jgi:hypothetical protein
MSDMQRERSFFDQDRDIAPADREDQYLTSEPQIGEWGIPAGSGIDLPASEPVAPEAMDGVLVPLGEHVLDTIDDTRERVVSRPQMVREQLDSLEERHAKAILAEQVYNELARTGLLGVVLRIHKDPDFIDTFCRGLGDQAEAIVQKAAEDTAEDITRLTKTIIGARVVSSKRISPNEIIQMVDKLLAETADVDLSYQPADGISVHFTVEGAAKPEADSNFSDIVDARSRRAPRHFAPNTSRASQKPPRVRAVREGSRLGLSQRMLRAAGYLRTVLEVEPVDEDRPQTAEEILREYDQAYSGSTNVSPAVQARIQKLKAHPDRVPEFQEILFGEPRLSNMPTEIGQLSP